MLPGISFLKIRKATMNNTTPSSAKITAAAKFDDRLVNALVMSFSPAVAGAHVDVGRAIGARIVAHGARHVLHFTRIAPGPAAPLHGGQRAEKHETEQEIEGCSGHGALFVVVVIVA